MIIYTKIDGQWLAEEAPVKAPVTEPLNSIISQVIDVNDPGYPYRVIEGDYQDPFHVYAYPGSRVPALMSSPRKSTYNQEKRSWK